MDLHDDILTHRILRQVSKVENIPQIEKLTLMHGLSTAEPRDNQQTDALGQYALKFSGADSVLRITTKNRFAEKLLTDRKKYLRPKYLFKGCSTLEELQFWPDNHTQGRCTTFSEEGFTGSTRKQMYKAP